MSLPTIGNKHLNTIMHSFLPFTRGRVLFALVWLITFGVSWLLLAPDVLYRPIQAGLDPSWNIGVQLAIKSGLTFGEEIVFTYGPLGFLAIRLPIGVSVAQFLLFDLLVMAVLLWMLAGAWSRLRSYWRLFLAVMAIVALSGYVVDYPSGITTLLLLLTVALLLHDLGQRSALALVAAAGISTVGFYIKLNTGLFGVVVFLGYMAYSMVLPKRHSRWFTLALTTIYGAVLLAAARLLNTDLAGYLVNGLHVISSHNEGMALSPDIYAGGGALLTMAVLSIAALGWAMLGNLRSAPREPDRWVAYGLAAVFVFAIFKYSFSRADVGHSRVFFMFAPAMIGLLALANCSMAQARLGKVFVAVLIFSSAALGPLLSWDYLTTKVDSLRAYVVAAQRPGDETPPAHLARNQALPTDVLAIIGDATVDIMPWEISVIYANRLNYSPRPIIQSYAVLDGALDAMNAARFAGPDAPTYVLYSVGEIDERHPFATESQTKLALLANYEVMQRFDQYLLLRQREQPRLLLETPRPEQWARLGETIALPSGGVQLITTDIRYTALGRLATTLYQPSPLNVTTIFSDGQEQTFQAVRGIANGGMIVNPFVEHLQQAELFFELGQGRQVTGIRFESPASWAYRDEFTYQITQVDVPQDSTRWQPVGNAVAITPSDPNVIFDGWHPLESQVDNACQWSDGHSARLFFRTDSTADDAASEMTIDIKAGTFHTQTISVQLNGAPLGVMKSVTHWEPAVYSFAIAPQRLTSADGQPQLNQMEFLMPGAASPASLDPANRDTRLLGLCLWEMRLH